MLKIENLEYINSNHTFVSEKEKEQKLKRRNYLTLLSLILAIVLLGISLFIILRPLSMITEYLIAGVGVFTLFTLGYFYFIFSKTLKKSILISSAILLLLIGLSLIYFIPAICVLLFKIVTIVSGLAISAFLFINVYREYKIKVSPWLSLFWAIVYLALDICIAFIPISFTLLVGAYLFIFSISVIYECYGGLSAKKDRSRKNYIISLPTFILFIFPNIIFKYLNTLVREDPSKILTMQEKGIEPDLVIYIQLRKGFVMGFGHAEMLFDGTVYSFGDFDHKSAKLGGILSDGIIAESKFGIHIKNELKDNNKLVLAYGLKLTEDQKEKVRTKLNEVMSKSYRWEPEIKLKDGTLVILNPEKFVDDGRRLHQTDYCTFYKFHDGSQFKIYDGMTENCAKFVNDVVGVTGIKLIRFNGVITPGSYLAYLEELFSLDDSIVVDRRLYSLDSNGAPLEYPASNKKKFKLNNENVEFKKKYI